MVLVMRYIEVTDDGSSRRSGTVKKPNDELKTCNTLVINRGTTFLLRDNAHGVTAPNPDASNTAVLDGFERVLNLVQAALR